MTQRNHPISQVSTAKILQPRSSAGLLLLTYSPWLVSHPIFLSGFARLLLFSDLLHPTPHTPTLPISRENWMLPHFWVLADPVHQSSWSSWLPVCQPSHSHLGHWPGLSFPLPICSTSSAFLSPLALFCSAAHHVQVFLSFFLSSHGFASSPSPSAPCICVPTTILTLSCPVSHWSLLHGHHTGFCPSRCPWGLLCSQKSFSS